jgi:serine/threonine-protein kinase
MGEVWVARHRTLGEDVALKLLIEEPGFGVGEDRSTAVARFLFEAQVAARLSAKTRHIVRVTDHGEEQGLAYLVMELLEGQTLEKWLLLHERMSIGAVSNLVAQIARALEQAHGEGVVHRDLKPGNIFLAQDEDGRRVVKLLDFGIACAPRARRAFATAPGVLYGTPGYLSPEQLRSSSRIDHRCDLWALATVAYEALTGELPLPGCHAHELLRSLAAGRTVPIHERDPNLPPALHAFFERAFAADLCERYPGAGALSQAFNCASGLTDVGVAPSVGSAGRRGGTVLMRTLLIRASAGGVSRTPRMHLAALAVAMIVFPTLLAALSTMRAGGHPSPTSSTRGAIAAVSAAELAASYEEKLPATGPTLPTQETASEATALAASRTVVPAPVPTGGVERRPRPAEPPFVAPRRAPPARPLADKQQPDKSRVL